MDKINVEIEDPGNIQEQTNVEIKVLTKLYSRQETVDFRNRIKC